MNNLIRLSRKLAPQLSTRPDPIRRIPNPKDKKNLYFETNIENGLSNYTLIHLLWETLTYIQLKIINYSL